MDEYTKISHKRYCNNLENDKKIKYLKNLITRILLSIILVISISIYIKIGENNSSIVKEKLFSDSFEFTKMNKWYQERLGKLIPQSNNSNLVFSNDDISKNDYEKYLDGVKINMSNHSPVTLLNGGIVVFIGDKKDYGNTIIVQGNDGIDYWYGNISNSNINLYDYLEKDTLIGEATDDYIYLVLEKDGSYLDYATYLQ